MLFADLALARRIDLAEGALCIDVAEATQKRDRASGAFARPLAGGIAVFTGADSPVTKVIGVGFEGIPSDAEIDAVERAFFERGASVRAEVATLADPEFCAQLTGRGYVLQGFENVLGRPMTLVDGEDVKVANVEVVEATDEREWTDVVIAGFEHPDTGVVSAPGESFSREALERIIADVSSSRGFRQYVARVGGEPAGGASLRLFDGVAQLCGAATLPSFRRRGVQTAMLQVRLRDARRAGCDLAVLTTQPGSKSQQNVQRRGFVLLYTRAILVKKAS
jgi:ribosomal protein S18 acetylase RimI-like enzyme